MQSLKGSSTASTVPWSEVIAKVTVRCTAPIAKFERLPAVSAAGTATFVNLRCANAMPSRSCLVWHTGPTVIRARKWWCGVALFQAGEPPLCTSPLSGGPALIWRASTGVKLYVKTRCWVSNTSEIPSGSRDRHHKHNWPCQVSKVCWAEGCSPCERIGMSFRVLAAVAAPRLTDMRAAGLRL